MEKIYLDNAATTPLLEKVMDEMILSLRNDYGNPSSLHSFGQEAKVKIEEQRRKIASLLNVQPGEIIFTSGGTEANNMIINSCVENIGIQRIITTKIEHKSVHETCLQICQRRKIELVLLEVNHLGEINLNELERLLKSSDKKTLVTLMHANNEIGRINDIRKISELCQHYQALFHSDTVQTMGHLELDFSDVRLDFASCSAHKFHGPKGVGFAFVRKSSGLKSFLLGGAQERGFRAGTENIAGIIGLGTAFQLAYDELDERTQKIIEIKKYTKESLRNKIEGILFNESDGASENLPTILSILVPTKNPMLSMLLDMKGIAISEGSACSSGAKKKSEVMEVILTQQQKNSYTPIRVSFSHLTTKREIDIFVKVLQEIVCD